MRLSAAIASVCIVLNRAIPGIVMLFQGKTRSWGAQHEGSLVIRDIALGPDHPVLSM